LLGDALGYDDLHHRFCPLLGELQVGIVGAHIFGVALHQDIQKKPESGDSAAFFIIIKNDDTAEVDRITGIAEKKMA